MSDLTKEQKAMVRAFRYCSLRHMQYARDGLKSEHIAHRYRAAADALREVASGYEESFNIEEAALEAVDFQE